MASPRKILQTADNVFVADVNPKKLPIVLSVKFHAGVEMMKMAQTMNSDSKRTILEDTNDLIFISKGSNRIVKVAKAQCKSWELAWDSYFGATQ